MRESIRSRRVLALIAAYVVALQALLLPLTVAAGAVYDSSLCIGGQAADKPAPASHDTGCACAAGCGMQCGAQTAHPPPQDAFAVIRAQARAFTPVWAFDPIGRPADLRRPVSRGPPAA